MIAITRVQSHLGSNAESVSGDALCTPILEDLTDGFNVRSFPQGTTSTTSSAIPLSTAEVEHLEFCAMRGQQCLRALCGLGRHRFRLITYNQMTRDKSSRVTVGVQLRHVLQVLPFWTCSITPVQCEIDRRPGSRMSCQDSATTDSAPRADLSARSGSHECGEAVRQGQDRLRSAEYGDCILDARVAHYVGETAQFNKEQLVQTSSRVAKGHPT